jgi:PKD repeat protein
MAAGNYTVSLIATNAGGSGSVIKTNYIFVILKPPTVTSISPANGPAAGGTKVTITGTGFTSASTVRFGSIAASATYNSATSLTATSPAGAGTVDVRVTTPSGTSAIGAGDKFTYDSNSTKTNHLKGKAKKNFSNLE